LTVGTPKEIALAKTARRALTEELNAKIAEARTPLTEAEAKRDALDKPDPRGYYYPRRYNMKRCGNDGCGGVCEAFCKFD
jgi:hypothetical protein